MSISTELCYLSIEEAGARLRAGDLSPVELTRACLDRIEAHDGRLHSYLHVASEKALASARRAEAEMQRGEWRGPLHGIPVALKDIFDTAGIPTTGGSRIYRNRVPERDATVSARLEAAGAVLLGKLTMSELAMTGAPGFGEEARNPWNLDCAPGWSSSGSGVAVAAGLCAGACGSDSGGSIRFPASYNNVVGLMPTYGRVSRHGVIPLTWSIDHLGPMTRCVEDAALMLGVIAGHDPEDRTSSRAPVPDYRAALREEVRGLKVGVLRQGFEGAEPETRHAVERAIAELETLGAVVEEVRVPHFEEMHVANCILYLSEGFAIYREALERQARSLGRVFRMYTCLGALFSAEEYIQAQRLRSRTRREVAALFERVDLLALPAASGPAQPLADFDPFMLTSPSRSAPLEIFNLAACPALSVPCGFSAAGLPIGLQLAARPFDEAGLLRAAYALQQHLGLHLRHPELQDALGSRVAGQLRT